MKKYFAMIAMAMLMAVPSSAQLQWGVLGGLNLSKVNTNGQLLDNLEKENMAGWYFGPKVNFTVPLVGIGVDAALLYSQKKLNMDNDNKTFRSIEVPLNLRYTFGFSSLAAVYVATGPQFGFNVGNSKWTIQDASLINEAMGVFNKEKMNTSWNIGAGAKFLGHIEVGLLYNIAISKYYKAAGSSDYNFKSNSFQIQAAYLF